MQWVKIGMCVTALAAFGCASNVEKHFGESYHAVTEQMIANPEAGQQPDDGVTVLEGETVENVMEQYRKGQTRTKSQTLPSSMITTGGKK
jgi:hypothetical protein